MQDEETPSHIHLPEFVDWNLRQSCLDAIANEKYYRSRSFGGIGSALLATLDFDASGLGKAWEELIYGRPDFQTREHFEWWLGQKGIPREPRFFWRFLASVMSIQETDQKRRDEAWFKEMRAIGKVPNVAKDEPIDTTTARILRMFERAFKKVPSECEYALCIVSAYVRAASSKEWQLPDWYARDWNTLEERIISDEEMAHRTNAERIVAALNSESPARQPTSSRLLLLQQIDAHSGLAHVAGFLRRLEYDSDERMKWTLPDRHLGYLILRLANHEPSIPAVTNPQIFLADCFLSRKGNLFTPKSLSGMASLYRQEEAPSPPASIVALFNT